MIKKRLQRTVGFISRVAVFVCSGVISAFLLMAGYESVYARDLPFVDTLEKIDLHAFADRQDLYTAADQTNARLGNFGRPQTLKLPDRALRLDIVPAIVEDGNQWLARANTMHMLVTHAPRSGNIGFNFLYCRSSFRTISPTALPKTGDNMFIDTDQNWRYVYRVLSAKVVPAKDDFVLGDDSKTGRLAIVCYNQADHSNTIVEATLLSVQGVAQ